MVNNNKLYARIIELGLTKREIADKMELSYTTIINKFNGKVDWTLNDAYKLRDILAITDEEIIPYFFS